jgi:hypothetical protein
MDFGAYSARHRAGGSVAAGYLVKSLPIDAFDGSRYRSNTDNYLAPSNVSLIAVSRGKQGKKRAQSRSNYTDTEGTYSSFSCKYE